MGDYCAIPCEKIVFRSKLNVTKPGITAKGKNYSLKKVNSFSKNGKGFLVCNNIS